MMTTEQLFEVKELQRICEEEGGFQLKLNWDMLESRKEDGNEEFLHYEDGRPVGFLAIYGFGNKVEICGMVHPDYRRKGIFSRLFEQGLEEVRKRKFRKILLNAPTDSHSAKGFLKQIPCSFSIAEYQMKWQETKLDVVEGVILRPSVTDEDHESEIQLDVQCFGLLEEEAREFNNRTKRDKSEQFLIIEAEGKTVGKIRVSDSGSEAWIYGFSVFPEFQGKGIGRKALSKVVQEERKKGFPVFLEVEAKNAHALRLYESCGFKAYHSQDYYEYDLEKFIPDNMDSNSD